MKYRRLDENGDYSFGNNSLDYIKDNDAIIQAIRTKLYLFYGEWWEDISLGLPMFQSILGQVSNENLRRTVILLSAEQIQSVEGVISVDSIVVAISARKLTLSIDVTTEYGSSVSTEVELYNVIL
nr:MAG TPA: baseplate wedge protein [Caudoviricetes sp.]